MPRLIAALADRYTIERELGAGGMATVYLAHDMKHDRDVAIKVLHPDLGAALGAERFLSEIRTTARLQHSHILPLLDSGNADGLLYYVMPVVTGESLRARLERERQLPIPEAVRIAREVAGALDYAHRQGVIHRDIKPENILLHDGHALVADFGIALAVQIAGGQRMTQTGLSLGTPQYMSPEQAMGEKTIDARTDVYALGAVTYEMLAGDPPFTGSSVQAIVAKVMTERPTPLHTLRDTIPAGVEDAVLIALAKLPADRFATAAEFAAALTNPTGPTGAYKPRNIAGDAQRSRTAVIPGAVAVIAVAAAAWGWLRPTASHEPVTRVAVAMPAGQEIRPQYSGFAFDLSRDGTRLAYVGPGAIVGSTQLWVRPLDALAATPVPGTTGASSVEWSPDGRSLLYNETGVGSTAVVNVESGQVIRLPGLDDATWGSHGAVYALRNGGVLVRQQLGGSLDTVARIDSMIGSHRPLSILPDESAALLVPQAKQVGDTTTAQIVAVSFKTGKVSVVGPGVHARVLPDGRLLRTAADGAVYLVPFDSKSLRMALPGIPIARVAMGANSGNRSYPQISIADNGTMIYLSGVLQRERLVWLDADGRLERPTDVEGFLWGIALSPDGTQLAFSLDRNDGTLIAAGGGGFADVWVEDLKTGARIRLTSTLRNMRPSWSADGKYVLWARIGGPGTQSLNERRADASEPERLVLSRSAFGHSVAAGRWMPDHRTLVVATYIDGPAGRQIYAMTPGTDSMARPVTTAGADHYDPTPSPNGSLVAYISGESGTRELYVQPYPSGTGSLRVSAGGSGSGRWSHDGRLLYFWDQRGKLMAAQIQVRPTLAVAGMREVGGNGEMSDASPTGSGLFAIAPDGRVLVAKEMPGSFQMVLVRNWMAALHMGATP